MIAWQKRAEEAVREIQALADTCPDVLKERSPYVQELEDSFRTQGRDWQTKLEAIEKGGKVEATDCRPLYTGKKGEK